MQMRNRNLSESRKAFPTSRIYRKRESIGFGEAMRLPVSIDHVDIRPLDAGDSYPQVSFNDDEGLVLFDRSAEHHLYVPFLDMLLRQYRERPETRATVREWVCLRNSGSPLGFEALCDYLDLDADYFRDALTRWLNKVDFGRDVTRLRSSAVLSS